MALSDVDPKFIFWLWDGTTLKNLDELLESLEYMSRETFYYHVNNSKNDFVNWIRDVIKDEKLAKDLSKVKTKKETINILKSRLIWLKVKAGILSEDALKELKKSEKRKHKQANKKREDNKENEVKNTNNNSKLSEYQ